MKKLVSVVTVVLLVLSVQMAWAKPGKIWSCNSDGIPQTKFKNPRHVCIAGSGLTPGWYIYQVTDTHSNKRRNLSGFKARVRMGQVDQDGNLAPLSVWPFKPSAHGYCFWLLPIGKYVGPLDVYENAPFAARWSKVVRFKVRGPFPHLPIVMIKAWDDHNFDHYISEGEGEELPIPIAVVDPLGGKQFVTTTAEIPITMKGWWDFEINYSENFRLWVAMSRWIDGLERYSYPGWTVNLNDGESHLLYFGMYLPAPVTIYVFNDQNGNGRWESTEPPISGMWIYCAENGTPIISGISPPSGIMDFPPLCSGDYTFYPINIGSWIPTTPTLVSLNVVEAGNYKVYFGFRLP